MNARVWGFIQRTKLTIGFPFKFRRNTTLLTSSSGRSVSHSSDEKLVASPIQPRPPEYSTGTLESVLIDEKSSGSRLRPSAQDFSNSPQSFEDARENLQDGVQFNDSPSRIIVHNDGSAAVYAMILEEDLVAKQREILKYCRKRNYLKRKLETVTIEAMITEGNMNYTKKAIEETSDDKQSTAMAKDLGLEHEKFLSRCQLKDELKWDLDILETNLEYLKSQSQEIFEKALCAANMLNLPELDDDSIASIQGPTEYDENSAAISVRSSSTSISMEHTFHLALVEELEKKRMTFHVMLDAFDRRNEDLGKEQEEYEQAVQDGTCDLPQSDFDCMGIEMLQARTRDYIDAETAYEEVKARARAMRLLDNEFEQESNFIDDEDDGYRESHEATMTAMINEDGIEEWKAQIVNSQDIENLTEELEGDDWEAKSVGISDSISLVDYTRNGARISRWRNICRLAHVEDSADCL